MDKGKVHSRYRLICTEKLLEIQTCVWLNKPWGPACLFSVKLSAMWLPFFDKRHQRRPVADPEGEGGGEGGLDLLALSAIFPSVISSFFYPK